MLNVENKNAVTKFLNDEQIRELAPTVFQTKPSSEVSKHYTHIPTIDVVNDMRKLGWDVVDCKQVAARKKSTRGFQKHLVVFRNNDVVINGADGDTVYPQILLTNSHDGKNSFQFTAGLFRMICENGLVVSTTQFEDVRLRHMGYTFEELKVQIHELVERLPLTVESMNKMKQTQLDEKQALELAKNALTTRFKKDELKRITIDLKQLITPTRDEDKGKDLWSIFNVIQERIIDGDFEYASGTKLRKARKIKNFKQDQKVNKELFDMALEFVS